MEITQASLPASRQQVQVALTASEVNNYFSQALAQLSQTTTISGFRSGKAPSQLVKQQLSSDVVREKAVQLAVQALWQQTVEKITTPPISDPEVSIEEFTEEQPGRVTLEFDVRPKVELGDWRKIKLPPAEKAEATDEEVNELIHTLSQQYASHVLTLEPAKVGNKVELNFTGSVGGVTKEKLSAKDFPVLIGQKTTIPGFDGQLVGLKKGETKTFQLRFPTDHFDKELAGQLAEFKVEVKDVFTVILPALNAEFASKFGHKDMDELQTAIRADIAQRKNDEIITTQKAKWLAEFEQLVKVELPQSLVQAEVERSKTNWQQFLQERHISPETWLKDRQLTLAELEKDWRKAAVSSVTVGLGLAEVAKELKRDLGGSDDFNQLLTDLVNQAVVS